MFCQYCGTKIDAGENFCTSCGKAINNAPASQATAQQKPAQAVQPGGSNQIMKQGPLSYDTSLVKSLKGMATLYGDRLEWKGEKGMEIVIKISEILKTEVSFIKQTLAINLVNSQKHSFSKTVTTGDVAKQLAFGYLGSGSIIAELEGWRSAIDVVRGHS